MRLKNLPRVKAGLHASGFLFLLITFLTLTSCHPQLLNPCALPENAETPEQITLNVFSSQVDIYVIPSVQEELPDNAAVALIINGNCYQADDYEDLASFLAAQGFIAAVAERPGGDASVDHNEFVTGALHAIFQELNLLPNTPVALIGHSVGGQTIVNAAVFNADNCRPFNIDALVAIAPAFNELTPINGNHADAFLFIYGSQDEDVEGDDSTPEEAFAAYDIAGSQGNTTCSGAHEFCVLNQVPFEKEMIYIHGAGHAGLINQNLCLGLAGTMDPTTSFLSVEDQFCITRGYINAFLRYQLRNDYSFQDIVRGQVVPLGIAVIETEAPDELGNPAGSPVHISYQYSPPQRKLIENLEDGELSLQAQSDGINLQIVENLNFANSPNFVRHLPDYLVVGWENTPDSKWFRLMIPENSRNTTHFNSLIFRAGQFVGAPANFANTPNEPIDIQVCIYDHNSISCRTRTIPATDLQPDGVSHSAMSTLTIPLDSFSGITRSDVRRILFRFNRNTQGTVLMDNIEWVR